MIVVTGAGGKLGRAILEKLLQRTDAGQIVASTRDPAKAADLASRGVRVRAGDFTDPASLRHAFEGATQVLIVSSNAEASGGDAVAQHRNAIAAAQAVGARRILYTSHVGAAAESNVIPMRTHAATEAVLRECGVPFTALRNGFYATSSAFMMGDVKTTRRIDAPLDGKVSWTTHVDLAEAAAVILTDDGRFDGPTPPLTASHAFDLADLAAMASEVLGTPIERRIVSDEAFVQQKIACGMPERPANMLVSFYEAARGGAFAAVGPLLAELLGRAPISMREVLAERLA